MTIFRVTCQPRITTQFTPCPSHYNKLTMIVINIFFCLVWIVPTIIVSYHGQFYPVHNYIGTYVLCVYFFLEMLPFKSIFRYQTDSAYITLAHSIDIAIMFLNSMRLYMLGHNVHLLITCMFLYFIYEHCTAACETVERQQTSGDSSMKVEPNNLNTALPLHKNNFDDKTSTVNCRLDC
jgi:hypothetical protein